MPPKKKPMCLFKLSIKSCINLIDCACFNIEKCNPEREFPEGQGTVLGLKEYLFSILPSQLFDILCEERSCVPLRADPRIQLTLLTHPNMTTFRKCDLDGCVPQYFWMYYLVNLTRLTVLDLKLICTDEILGIVGQCCLQLEELNAISKVDIRRSPFNASVLIRHVSDTGLDSISSLKHLRILSMDAPRNARANWIGFGRCISQNGIGRLVYQLPKLQELRVESCDIGSTLITSSVVLKPLNLTKINCLFASVDGVKRLLSLCPRLKEFSCTHLSEQGKEEILQNIGASELELSKLELAFFSFNYAMSELLRLKGPHLTHFSLWEVDTAMKFDTILIIGECCPRLESFKLSTLSKQLKVSSIKLHKKLFGNLRSLTIGCANFSIEEMVIFFANCSLELNSITVKYQSKINLDRCLTHLLEAGLLSKLRSLWLDCTVDLSKSVLWKLVQLCDNLQLFVANFQEDMTDVQNYIRDNNLDLRLDY